MHRAIPYIQCWEFKANSIPIPTIDKNEPRNEIVTSSIRLLILVPFFLFEKRNKVQPDQRCLYTYKEVFTPSLVLASMRSCRQKEKTHPPPPPPPPRWEINIAKPYHYNNDSDIPSILSYSSLDLAVFSLKVSTSGLSTSSFLYLTLTLTLNPPSCQYVWHPLQTVSGVERLLLSNDDFPCLRSKQTEMEITKNKNSWARLQIFYRFLDPYPMVWFSFWVLQT